MFSYEMSAFNFWFSMLEPTITSINVSIVVELDRRLGLGYIAIVLVAANIDSAAICIKM